MGQLSQGSGLSGNTVRVTAALFVGVLFRKCLQSHGTRLGFGLGTLTGESCLKNVHCHTDRASWDAILVTVVAFGALMWKKCAQSHSFGLGRVGGGIPLGGGGRRTENRDHILDTKTCKPGDASCLGAGTPRCHSGIHVVVKIEVPLHYPLLSGYALTTRSGGCLGLHAGF